MFLEEWQPGSVTGKIVKYQNVTFITFHLKSHLGQGIKSLSKLSQFTLTLLATDIQHCISGSIWPYLSTLSWLRYPTSENLLLIYLPFNEMMPLQSFLQHFYSNKRLRWPNSLPIREQLNSHAIAILEYYTAEKKKEWRIHFYS